MIARNCSSVFLLLILLQHEFQKTRLLGLFFSVVYASDNMHSFFWDTLYVPGTFRGDIVGHIRMSRRYVPGTLWGHIRMSRRTLISVTICSLIFFICNFESPFGARARKCKKISCGVLKLSFAYIFAGHGSHRMFLGHFYGTF